MLFEITEKVVIEGMEGLKSLAPPPWKELVPAGSKGGGEGVMLVIIAP